jgi:glycosyltransferase involved in cell wall biosynthesis
MISVAMCTFNGSRYVDEQLSSIRAQTRMPDELVICDDRSTDETFEIIKTFARHAPFPVHAQTNEENLGSTKNFEKAISLCRGDIIALSDQDDIWLPWRLQDTEATFTSNPELGFVFGDGYAVDHDGNPTGHTLWKSFDFTFIYRFQMTHGYATLAFLNRHVATGATMAFRSAIREFCLPIPPIWTHDAWIALISSCVYGVGLLPRPIIKYRKHVNQQIGANYLGLAGKIMRPRKLGIYEYDKCVAQYETAYRRLSTMEGTEDKRKLVSAKIQHLRNRNFLPSQRHMRIAIIVKELASLRYTLYSTGLLGAVRDLTVSSK